MSSFSLPFWASKNDSEVALNTPYCLKCGWPTQLCKCGTKDAFRKEEIVSEADLIEDQPPYNHLGVVL